MSDIKPASRIEGKFLGYLKDQKLICSIYLVNGVKLRGIVLNYDETTLCVSHNNQTGNHLQLIYKHAISTVLPEEIVPLEDTVRVPQ